jgi:hypothetical protein
MRNYSMSTPYTYLIGWSTHNVWYYGRRSGAECHPSDLWVTYFTSSKWVKQFREKHGEPDVVKIRRVFPTAEQAQMWETKVLTRLNAARDPKFLNKRNGDSSPNFNTRRCANAKTTDGAYIGSVSLDDPRWATGEIVGVAKGAVRSDSTKRKMSDARKNTAVAVLPDGTKKRVPLNDPRWATGEIYGCHKGRDYGKQTPDHIKKRADARRGKKHSDETRRAFSEARKGVKRGPRDPVIVAKVAETRLRNGTKMPEDTKIKWSEIRKGKKPAFDENGNSLGLIDVSDPRWGTDIFTRLMLAK